ncbi:hypothetical protein M2347_004149 [Chryseobacterium sp. H1D6B]|nr:hypothetical protein [Chryseobacterium sp. H1D6B]
MLFLNDLGTGGVKKMNTVNVKKTLLSECGPEYDYKPIF